MNTNHENEIEGVQFLVATVDGRSRTNESIAKLPNKLIINQQREVFADRLTDSFINTDERGISKSRNMALRYADGDICYIADDDLQFVDDAILRIEAAYKKHPNADVVVFPLCFNQTSGDSKKYLPDYFPLKLRIMGVSSCEISFRTKAIKEANISFDERFGLGSDYPSGEENVFLSDCINNGLKIVLSDQYVAIHPKISSGSSYEQDVHVRAKGAILARCFGKWSYLLLILFALKSRNLYRAQYSLIRFLSLALSEASTFLRTASRGEPQ
jgi:glycosyltransferase involved in cell wall biosynthesis